MTFPIGRCLSLKSLSALITYHYTRSIHIQRESLCTSNEAWYRSLPLRETSRFWSRFFSMNIYPRSIRNPIYKYFSRLFDADINECEHGPDHLDNYPNFGAFFRRNLKPGVRPIDPESLIVSPCDGEILANGLVTSVENLNINIKGIPYTIKDLFQFDQYEIERLQAKQSNSSLFYACIYLNPGNYHHFHSPAQWKIHERRHITGELMSVRPEFIIWIPNLLLLNERVVYLGEYQHGLMSQTMIGATNVGSIDVYFDQTLKTNQKLDDYTFRIWKEKFLTSEQTTFDKGQAFGEFKLGSCIVLIFEAPSTYKFVRHSGDKIRVGERL
jgi:phosphatidylserine decarboxylase